MAAALLLASLIGPAQIGIRLFERVEDPRHARMEEPQHGKALSRVERVSNGIGGVEIAGQIARVAAVADVPLADDGWETLGDDVLDAYLAAANVADRSLPDMVAGLLARHAVPGDRLECEISEDTVMGMKSHAILSAAAAALSAAASALSTASLAAVLASAAAERKPGRPAGTEASAAFRRAATSLSAVSWSAKRARSRSWSPAASTSRSRGPTLSRAYPFSFEGRCSAA